MDPEQIHNLDTCLKILPSVRAKSFGSIGPSSASKPTPTPSSSSTQNDVQHSTPPKKRRHSNDANERRTTSAERSSHPTTSSAFTTFENHSHLRLSLQQQQQQQQRLTSYRPDSVRHSLPAAGRAITPPSRILEETQNQLQPISRHNLRGTNVHLLFLENPTPIL